MVYGDHGRKLLYPLTVANIWGVFPFKQFYQKSLHFRLILRTSAVLLAGYTYFVIKSGGTKGLEFTPYTSVHHSIGHKFAHDLEHLRYPIEHHHGEKKQH